jgi:hypothetical protein
MGSKLNRLYISDTLEPAYNDILLTSDFIRNVKILIGKSYYKDTLFLKDYSFLIEGLKSKNVSRILIKLRPKYIVIGRFDYMFDFFCALCKLNHGIDVSICQSLLLKFYLEKVEDH